MPKPSASLTLSLYPRTGGNPPPKWGSTLAGIKEQT